MNAPTDTIQILRDVGGNPVWAVIPYADYQALIRNQPKAEPGIPADVVDLALDNDWSAARAWREYLQLTQADVAQRIGITQGAYAQLEAKKTIRKTSREKIAAALGLHESQFDF